MSAERRFYRSVRAALEERFHAHMTEAYAYEEEGAHIGLARHRRALAAGVYEAILLLDEQWREREVFGDAALAVVAPPEAVREPVADESKNDVGANPSQVGTGSLTVEAQRDSWKREWALCNEQYRRAAAQRDTLAEGLRKIADADGYRESALYLVAAARAALAEVAPPEEET